jgi:hypothetical protein
LLKGNAKRDGSRAFIYSFFLTFLILILVAVAMFNIPSSPITQHLPTTYDFKRSDWMKYVSLGAEKISMMNFSRIFMEIGNQSLFSSDKFLMIQNVTTEIKILDLEFSVTVLYQNLDPNLEDLALNIMKPKQDLFVALRREFEEKAEIRFPYKNRIIIQVNECTENQTTYVESYIAMDGAYFLFSEGDEGLDLIKQSLDTAEKPSQFFEQQQVKASLHLILSNTGVELGFSYSILPYAVKEVNSVSTSILYEENLVTIHYVFAFNDMDTALQNLDNIKKANLSATDFQIIDNYIMVTAKYGSDSLVREFRSL